MGRFPWVWLLASILLLGSVLSQSEEDDGDLEDSHVEIEPEDGDEPKKGGFQLNLVDEKSDPGPDVFVPTKEWQTVKKDQPVPKGLHYRLNMATGLVEAKLLDESEDTQESGNKNKPASGLVATGIDGSESGSKSSSFEESKRMQMKKTMEEAIQELADQKDNEGGDNLQYWQDGDKEGMVNLKGKSFSPEEIKEALKKFKKKDDDVKDEAGTVKNKFRSMKDIKQDFDALNMQMKTDTEILRELLTKYQDEQLSTDDRVGVLTDLEYYLHQIDNAVVFADMGGLDLIIKDLNHTSTEVKTEAAFVIGSSTQSNPKVQVRVLKAGGIHQMIRMLSTETSDAVKSRVLYALSCTLRHFPFAQKSFVDNGGIHTLTNIVSQSTSGRLRLKAMTLAMDMLHERELAELHTRIAKASEFERLQQYKEVHIRNALLEKGWCELVPQLLADPDHDTREKVLTPMGLLVDSCHSQFHKSKDTLESLKTEYSSLAQQEKEEDGEEGFFAGLLKLINDLLDKLKSSEKSHLKEEL